jgi:dienelactone hydrolase
LDSNSTGKDRTRSRIEGAVSPASRSPSSRAAVIITPTIAGIDDYIQRVAYRLNEVGYAVVLIDYYKEGRAPDLGTMPNILEAVAALSDTKVSCSVRSAKELLLERADIDGDRIATLGFVSAGPFQKFRSGLNRWRRDMHP